MRYLKTILIACLLLVGCSPKQEQSVKILSPTGAPALSLLDVDAEIDYVTGSELLGSQFVKDDGEYDIILAPVNLGVKMIEEGKSDYRLKAVITWGNLYVVATREDALSKEGEFASFGEGSVVDFVFKQTLDPKTMVPNITMYASAQDVQAALLSGKATSGLLAQPAVTATIQKAKEQGIDLKIIANLQEKYQEKFDTEFAGFPQAAIFVKEGSEEKSQQVLESIENFVNKVSVEDPNHIMERVDEIGADVLGVPNAKISMKTWNQQNIHYVEATDCQEDLNTLFSLMKLEITKDIYSK